MEVFVGLIGHFDHAPSNREQPSKIEGFLDTGQYLYIVVNSVHHWFTFLYFFFSLKPSLRAAGGGGGGH